MNKKISSLWISFLMSLIFLSGDIHVGAYLGINWGRTATQTFVPSMVVDLLLQNGIPELRLFQPSLNVLDAFADTNIGLAITLQENFLRNVVEQKQMDDYIHERVKVYSDKGVKFRQVMVIWRLLSDKIGWPTDGYVSASEANAERFHRSLLQYISRKDGTPLRPNRDIDMYLLGLTDENKVATDYGPYQRHWGIYKHDGLPKYKIDFTMQDRDVKPTIAKGTVRMPNRWCVFDGKTDHNETQVLQDYDYACGESDCTAFGAGATCDHLSFHRRRSLNGYNMFIPNE
uniref:Glucan endo-1,3-beta-glucosidase 5 n=1 Tax=Solanum tuberosum TaxID=4113 RepID=M1BAY0_SOLTU